MIALVIILTEERQRGKFGVEKAPNSASRKTYRVAFQNRKTKKARIVASF